MPESTDQPAQERSTTPTSDPRLNFRNPNFIVHPSCLPFAIPLSKLAKFAENQGRKLEAVVIALNPAGEVLLLDEPGGLPKGPAQFGVDQTILESVVRVVRDQTGIRVVGIRSLVGVHSPPAQNERPDEQRKRCYAFLAACTPPDARGKGYSFRKMEEIDLDELDTADRSCLRAARDYISTKTRDSTYTPKELVGIPPTQLVKPTFHVAGDLKAYLLPFSVFAELPINKDKALSAGGVLIHPEPDRKILLLQRANTGHWDFPSAMSDSPDLSIVHLAVQAVRSATGLEVRGVRGLVGSFERGHLDSRKEEKRYLFLLKPVTTDVKLVSEKWKSFRWVRTVEDVEGMDIVPEVRVVVDHVLQALAKRKAE